MVVKGRVKARASPLVAKSVLILWRTLECLGLLSQGGGKPFLLQHLGAQLEDERPHLGEPRFG